MKRIAKIVEIVAIKCEFHLIVGSDCSRANIEDNGTAQQEYFDVIEEELHGREKAWDEDM